MSCLIACLRLTIRDTHGLVAMTRFAAWTGSRLHVSKISLHAVCVLQPALSGKLAISGLQEADAWLLQLADPNLGSEQGRKGHASSIDPIERLRAEVG